MAQNHLESELVDGTAMPLVDPDNMACGDNELEGSMLLPTPPNPEGDVSDTNVLDAPAIHTDHVGVLPSGAVLHAQDDTSHLCSFMVPLELVSSAVAC